MTKLLFMNKMFDANSDYSENDMILNNKLYDAYRAGPFSLFLLFLVDF